MSLPNIIKRTLATTGLAAALSVAPLAHAQTAESYAAAHYGFGNTINEQVFEGLGEHLKTRGQRTDLPSGDVRYHHVGYLATPPLVLEGTAARNDQRREIILDYRESERGDTLSCTLQIPNGSSIRYVLDETGTLTLVEVEFEDPFGLATRYRTTSGPDNHAYDANTCFSAALASLTQPQGR